MTDATTPTTPHRPPRSLYRVNTTFTLASPLPGSLSTPTDDILATPSTPSTDDALVVNPTSPETPTTQFTRSKSVSSIKRKPVPLNLVDASIPAVPTTPTRTAGSSRRDTTESLRISALPTPPIYTLAVDPPLPSPAPSYPSYPPRPHDRPHHSSFVGLHEFGVSAGVGTSSRASEDLPVYSEQGNTESNTLARELWKWGWICPLLWGIGMTILWVPLNHDVEEDPEKAQRMQELCSIVRKTELKHAKRCMYGFIGFCSLVAIITALVVVLKVAL